MFLYGQKKSGEAASFKNNKLSGVTQCFMISHQGHLLH